MRRWLGRRLLRRELEEAHGDLTAQLVGATEFAEAGESYAIGRIEGLREGVDRLGELVGRGYPRRPTVEDLEG